MLKKIALMLCLALLLASLLAGCGQEAAETTTTATGTTTTQSLFTDQAGRVVEIPESPQKIVSLAPSNTEILFAMGLADRVVGVTDYCNYPEEVSTKTRIGGYWTPDLEKIVSLDPDLVVTQALHEAEIIPKLEEYGITAIVLEPLTIEDVLDAITLIGDITGEADAASSLVDSLRQRVERITSVTSGLAGADRPGVFYLTWHDPLITVGSNNIGHDLIVKAGGRNIFESLEGSPDVSLENIIDADPDVIIAGIGMGTGGDEPLTFIQNESRLSDTSAVSSGAVYSVSIDISGRAGPRIVEALESFARFIHPDLFE